MNWWPIFWTIKDEYEMRFDGCQATGDQYFLCQNRQKPKPINEFEIRAPAISLSHFNNISFALLYGRRIESSRLHWIVLRWCRMCSFHSISVFRPSPYGEYVASRPERRNGKPFLVLTYVMSSILRFWPHRTHEGSMFRWQKMKRETFRGWWITGFFE